MDAVGRFWPICRNGAWLTDELSDAFDALANALFAEGSGLAFGMKGFEGVG